MNEWILVLVSGLQMLKIEKKYCHKEKAAQHSGPGVQKET